MSTTASAPSPWLSSSTSGCGTKTPTTCALVDYSLALTRQWSADSGASPASINNNYNAIIQAAGAGKGVITLTHELSLKVTAFFINNFAALQNAYSTAVVSAHICSNITRVR